MIVNGNGERPNPEILRVVENHQRRNLEPLEEAAAIRALLEAGLDAQTVARSLGRSRAWVARRSSLLVSNHRTWSMTPGRQKPPTLVSGCLWDPRPGPKAGLTGRAYLFIIIPIGSADFCYQARAEAVTQKGR